MRGIPIYAEDCEDFSSNGLGFLLPTECTVEEQANGLYELTLVQPLGERGWERAVSGRILKAMCPARESPLYEAEVSVPTTVTRDLYRVYTIHDPLRLRQKPSLSAKCLSLWPHGTEVICLDKNPPDQAEANSWYQVTIRNGGQTGYMWKGYLDKIGEITQTITPTKPVGRDGVKVTVSREQLFRIHSVENDTQAGLQTIKAMHVFYDLRGAIINETYEPEKEDAATAAAHVMGALTDETDFTLHCGSLTGEVTGSYDYCTPIDAWLDPDEGILAQSKGVMFRDNFDIYFLPDSERDMGVTIRRGKNLIGVTATADSTDIVTRIIPCGKKKNGDPLFLDYAKDRNGNTVSGATVYYIESPHAGRYTRTYTKKVDYDVKVDSDGDFTTEAAARAELERLAYADYDDGCDMPAYSMDVDFIMLRQNAGEDLSEWAQLQAVHMFDTVTVIDEVIGLESRQRVTGYVWDVLTEQYESLTLGDPESVKQTIYSYNLPSGGISGKKIANGSVTASSLAAASVTTGKLASGSVTSEKLADGVIGTDEIADGAVTADKIASGAVTGAKIASNAVTSSKIASVNAGTISAGTLDAARLPFKIAWGTVSATSSSATAPTMNYSAAGFTSLPSVVCSFAKEGSNDAGDWGSLKIFDKTLTGAKVVIGGSGGITKSVDWVAIGI